MKLDDFYHTYNPPHWKREGRDTFAGFVSALENGDGRYWNNRLEAAGFQVWSAV